MTRICIINWSKNYMIMILIIYARNLRLQKASTARKASIYL